MNDDDEQPGFILLMFLIIVFGVLTLSGCATQPAPVDQDRNAYELEYQRLIYEYDLMQDRVQLLKLCKYLYAHEDWDQCYEKAGLER